MLGRRPFFMLGLQRPSSRSKLCQFQGVFYHIWHTPRSQKPSFYKLVALLRVCDLFWGFGWVSDFTVNSRSPATSWSSSTIEVATKPLQKDMPDGSMTHNHLNGKDATRIPPRNDFSWKHISRRSAALCDVSWAMGISLSNDGL